MRVTEVSYSRLVSFGSYQNATIGAKAEVGGEGAENALEELRDLVEAQAATIGRADKSAAEVQEVEWRLESKRAEERQLEERCRRLTAFLEKHGVTLAEEPPF
jgi:predicted nuclease with TOPRIM domain